jgi:hypothetical protein
MKKLIYLLGIALVITLLVSGGASGLVTAIEDAAAQNVACYGEQGGAKHVAASGCEYEFRSGSTLDVQSGTTFGMAGAINLTQVNAAGGSANPFDYTGTLGIMDNNDTFELFDINLTNPNHTGANNVVTVMDIAAITGDAQATETGISIGTGWDTGLDLNGTPLVVGADGGVILDESADDVTGLTFGAGTGTFSILVGNGLVGNGAPTTPQNGEDFYVEGLLEVDGGATLGGTVALDASEIGAAEVADVTRSVPIPLMSFIECSTNGGATIEYTDGADAFPDFINSATDGLGFVLAFDDTGGQVDVSYVCSQLIVPQDYASGGAFAVRTTKNAETGANAEVLNCAGSINGAALGAGGTVTIATDASTRYTCTPTLAALAAGDSLSLELHVTGTVDDIVNIAAVEFVYTATQ